MDKRPEECWSLEAMDKEEYASEKDHLEKIGEEIFGTDPERKFVFWRDSKGRHWYTTMIHQELGWMRQDQAIFGRRMGKKKRPA